MIVVDSASQPPCRALVEAHGFAYLYATGARALAGAERRARGGADGARRVRRRRRRASRRTGRGGSPRRSPTPAVGCVGGACLPALPRRLGPAGSRSACSSTPESRASGRGARVALVQRVSVRRERRLPPRRARAAASRSASAASAPHCSRARRPRLIDRLRDDGWRVRLEPAAVVRHAVSPDRLRSGYYWRRLWWQGRSRARGERSLRLTVRIVAALPVRLALFAATRDRVHLYRTAETTGYLRELAAR